MEAISKIGGRTGYYGADLLWKIRGIMDKLAGGVGLVRGRRSNTSLRVGDALDFWRIIQVTPASRLLLLAEMKTPGEALLEVRLNQIDDTRCTVLLLARFLPRGLFGIVYWYALYPIHQYVFTRMLKGLVDEAGLTFESKPAMVKPDEKNSCQLDQ
jgi:hypothetical protein